MGWIQALCETYDNYFDGEELDEHPPLVPVGFIEREMNIRVNLSPDGRFESASVVESKERLPAPTSPMAEGKTGQAIAYPLCDELRYTAGDFSSFTDADYSRYYDAYLKQLREWCARPDTPEELQAHLSYIEGASLVSDLISYGVLFTDENGKILDKWTDKKTKPAFFNLGKTAEKCIVDFTVRQRDEYVPLREMKNVQKSWQSTLLSMLPEKKLCCASGVYEATITNHAKIEGNAKLISAKDGPRDFQYKGRFTEAEQVCTLSYSASAKAHNTLRWLRARQGFQKYGSTFITWSPSCRRVISPQDGADDGWGVSDEDECRLTADAEQVYAKKIADAMAGYKKSPEYKRGANIVMLGMEAATPGRMSINFYQELDGEEYLERLNKWYTGCMWRLVRDNNGKLGERVTTPTIREIEIAVFGWDNVHTAEYDKRNEKSITKQIKSFEAEILSCIVNGRTVPKSAARTAFNRTCRPLAFTDSKGKWQRTSWLKSLAVTCAMLKSNKEEGLNMSSNENEKDPSVLFGKLMAVADCVEIFAMKDSDSQHRQTNAIRYFSAVQQRPGITWSNVEKKLQPYLTKLDDGLEKYYRNMLDEIEHCFKPGELASANKLSPRFLEGYHNQRYEILNKKKEK